MEYDDLQGTEGPHRGHYRDEFLDVSIFVGKCLIPAHGPRLDEHHRVNGKPNIFVLIISPYPLQTASSIPVTWE